jgi:hypothetical protein
METTNRDGHKLLFKGEEYRLAQLLSLAKNAPRLEVKLDELNLLGITKLAMAREEQPYVAVHVPILPEYQEHEVVFYKQEGKYTVLFGHEKVRLAYNEGKLFFKGRLISGPVLKKTRIYTVDLAAAIEEKVQEPTPVFNAPRFVQDTRVRSSHDGARRGIQSNSGPSHNYQAQARTPRQYSSSNETATRRDLKKP